MKNSLIFKLAITISLILTGEISVGQEFSFQIKFEDSSNNIDILIFGYAPSATASIDDEFQEINILDLEMDHELDVRFSDYIQQHPAPLRSHTKKQITTRNNFSYWLTISTIEIKCNNWPVTATWDSTLFNNSTYNGTLITAVHPGE